MMKLHLVTVEGSPYCGRVTKGCVKITNKAAEVTCRWCLRKLGRAPRAPK
jgi:hypothetical protein